MQIGDKVKIQYGVNFKTPHYIRGIFVRYSKTGKFGFVSTTSNKNKHYLLKRPVDEILKD